MNEYTVETYKVYIKINAENIVTAIDSSAFLADTEWWIEIDEGTGDRYHHAQGNYLPLGVTDNSGLYNYKYIDGVLSERSAEEKQAEYEKTLLPVRIEQRVAESKLKLAEWLRGNPLLFSDGKYYSVTEEKQSLLNSNLASYERATAAGITYPLKWNSTGEECVEWEYPSLLALSLSIAEYVAPRVAIQQATELQIKACTTLEECEAIVIEYS